MKSDNKFTYRSYFKREFEARVFRNPAYSLRAFARDLAIAAPKLSQILNGTCGMSKASAIAAAKSLRLSDNETEHFITLVEIEHSRSKVARNVAKERLEKLTKSQTDELNLEKFKIIADWYHFAILELTDLKTFQSSTEWIADRLGVDIETIRLAIERLLDHGLLIQSKGGKLKQSHAHLATPSGIPSRELRNHHSQILRKAEAALDIVPIEEREFSATTLSIDSSQIQEAKIALREFRRKFCKDLQENTPKDRVYCLSVQLFPLDKKDTEGVRE